MRKGKKLKQKHPSTKNSVFEMKAFFIHINTSLLHTNTGYSALASGYHGWSSHISSSIEQINICIYPAQLPHPPAQHPLHSPALHLPQILFCRVLGREENDIFFTYQLSRFTLSSSPMLTQHTTATGLLAGWN